MQCLHNSYQMPDGAPLLKHMRGPCYYAKFIFPWLQSSVLLFPVDMCLSLVRAQYSIPKVSEKLIRPLRILDLWKVIAPCSKGTPRLQDPSGLQVKGWDIKPGLQSTKIVCRTSLVDD